MFCHCDDTTEIDFHQNPVTSAKHFRCPLCNKELESDEIIRRLLYRLVEVEQHIGVLWSDAGKEK